MNKDQANKHKDVIIWFCIGDNEDKGVWCRKAPEYPWYESHSPEFYCNGTKYVQNDEYAELRKALADGKVIQYLRILLCPNGCNDCMSHSEWRDWNSYGLCFSSDTQYRIKPEEFIQTLSNK